MIVSYIFNTPGAPPLADPPWTAQDGALGINAGNYLEGQSMGFNVSYWNADTFGPAQFSEFTLDASSVGAYQCLTLRNNGADNYYFLWSNGSGDMHVQQNVAGSHNDIFNFPTMPYGLGDTVRVEIDSAFLMSFYLNNVFVFSYDDVSAPGALAAGQPGVCEFGMAYGIASWRGGDVAVPSNGGIFPFGGVS